MIKTTSELIDALGGNRDVAAMLDVGQSAVSNYRKTGFPPWTHRKLLAICTQRELRADDSLFVARRPRRSS